MVKLDAQRTAGELQVARGFDERAQRNAFQRNRMATPQRVNVDPMAEICCDHCQTGEPALCRLSLQGDRQMGAAAKIQKILLHDHILLWSSGSMIQRASERRSRMISALSSIPACSGAFSPLALT